MTRTRPGLMARKVVLPNFSCVLIPLSVYDAEMLNEAPDKTEYNLTATTRRSNRQNRMYWAILTNVVRATDRWPTAAHLHEDLLRACGFVDLRHDLDGKPYVATDSTRFEAMKADEFAAYFDAAMPRLADAVGFDPMQEMPERDAA